MAKDAPYGVTDPGTLRRLEEAATAFRMDDLISTPLPGGFDLEHMRQIHAHLFQDVYDWAGELRVVNMNKDGVSYAPHDDIERIWAAQHNKAKRSGLLRKSVTLETPDTRLRLAVFWGKVNHAHPFREGNTRSQAIFFKQLCQQAGWDLDIARLNSRHPQSLHGAFVDARYYFQLRGDATPLAEVLDKTLSRLPDRQVGLETPQPAPAGAATIYRKHPELRPEHQVALDAPRELSELEFGD